MDSKKLSKTVRKRLNKKAKFESNLPNKKNLSETPAALLTQKRVTKKETIVATQPNAKEKPVSTTITKRKRRKIPENRVIYINSNYGGSDPDSVGGRLQAEMVELRKQSKNIKSASDLTESQAHVIKRQITRLQGPVKEKKVFKRHQKFTQSIDAAAKELKLLMTQQRSKKN